MEAWNKKKPMREGAKLRLSRRPHRIVIAFDEPIDQLHLSFDEALALSKVLAEKARDARIIMPGDLGPALPRLNGAARKVS